MKIRQIIAVALLFAAGGAQGQLPQDINVDLPEMYKEIDEAIGNSPQYIADYRAKLRKVEGDLGQATNDEQRLMLLMQLSDMYESFNADSALNYTRRSMKVAHALGMEDAAEDCQARIAYLCTFLGSQTEALTILKNIDRAKLSKKGLISYYRAYTLLYNYMSINCKTPAMREESTQQYRLYMDSLLNAVPPESELYFRYREPMLVEEGKLDEALKMNNKRLNQAEADSHDDAIIAYNRFTIYQKKGDMEMAKYWLCRSALADVRNAVMDQTSLMTLAELLNSEGDTERANRYIAFTWECNRRYSPNMRSWQIAPLLSAIEQNYETLFDMKGRLLTIWAVIATILLIVLAVYLVTINKERKQLKKTHKELKESNEQLEQTNHKLEWTHKKVMTNNTELIALNKKLEEEIEALKKKCGG